MEPAWTCLRDRESEVSLLFPRPGHPERPEWQLFRDSCLLRHIRHLAQPQTNRPLLHNAQLAFSETDNGVREGTALFEVLSLCKALGHFAVVVIGSNKPLF